MLEIIQMDTNTDPKKKLTPEQFNICFLRGTEPPGSGKYLNNHEAGTYVCVSCGNILFKSETKFDSGTGWPSFWDMADKNNIKTVEDTSMGMSRTEVTCARCGAHLGHVFNDGPRDPSTGLRTGKTGLRYCINSLALNFVPKK